MSSACDKLVDVTFEPSDVRHHLLFPLVIFYNFLKDVLISQWTPVLSNYIVFSAEDSHFFTFKEDQLFHFSEVLEAG